MPQQNTEDRRALRVVAHTCADNFYSIADGTPTTMAQLSNLVPNFSNKDQWVPRPAATLLPNSSTFSPGYFSCVVVVGNYLYGLVSSAAALGYDQPFCYDILGGAFITVTGFTSGNVPLSPPTTGSWTPPHAEVVGTKIVVTSTGFSGSGSNFFGLLDISTPTAPVWSAHNIAVGTGGTALPSVPVWCSQFNGRAYFMVNPPTAAPAVIFSDINSPATFFSGTTAPYNNVLTFPGNLPITCGGQLAFNNQLGGQVQGLIIFQSDYNMYQITGDPAAIPSSSTANINQGALSINSLNTATGTLAPNSVCQTPKGLMFVAPDGVRLIDFTGRCSDPIGFGGTGITLPFYSCPQPTRINAECNAISLRIQVQNGAVVNQPQQEWVFDIVRQVWHGPHTFPINQIVAYATTFIVAPIGIAGLWQSNIIPTAADTYVENGVPLQCTWQTGYFPDRPYLGEMSCTRAVFYQAYGASPVTYTVSMLDSSANVLLGSPVSLSFSGSATLWGDFAWGYSVYLGTSSATAAVQVPWTEPIVFDRVAISITFTASAGITIADFLMDAEQQDYTVIAP
jgi:hypothetical protein